MKPAVLPLPPHPEDGQLFMATDYGNRIGPVCASADEAEREWRKRFAHTLGAVPKSAPKKDGIPRVAEQIPSLNIRPLAYDIDEATVENLLMNRLWHKHHRRFNKADKIRDVLSPFVEIMDDAEGTLWMWRPIP